MAKRDTQDMTGQIGTCPADKLPGRTGQQPIGLSRLSGCPDSSVELMAATTPARDAMPPHLLRIADALKARFNARLTYLATPSYTAGKPPQPAMGDTFTEYRK